jgi:hypothetical protein
MNTVRKPRKEPQRLNRNWLYALVRQRICGPQDAWEVVGTGQLGAGRTDWFWWLRRLILALGIVAVLAGFSMLHTPQWTDLPLPWKGVFTLLALAVGGMASWALPRAQWIHWVFLVLFLDAWLALSLDKLWVPALHWSHGLGAVWAGHLSLAAWQHKRSDWRSLHLGAAMLSLTVLVDYGLFHAQWTNPYFGVAAALYGLLYFPALLYLARRSNPLMVGMPLSALSALVCLMRPHIAAYPYGAGAALLALIGVTIWIIRRTLDRIRPNIQPKDKETA